jgi:hypothetical protein
MTVLQLIQLIAALAGAAKDISGVMEDIHARDLKPGDQIPAEHLAKVTAAMGTVANARTDAEWDADHQNTGG